MTAPRFQGHEVDFGALGSRFGWCGFAAAAVFRGLCRILPVVVEFGAVAVDGIGYVVDFIL